MTDERLKQMLSDLSVEHHINAHADGLKEGIFTQAIMSDCGLIFKEPLCITTDSKAAYDIVRNPGTTKRSLHFDRWLMFAREAYLNRKIAVVLVRTYKMMADDKTKVVDREKFLTCRQYQMNL